MYHYAQNVGGEEAWQIVPVSKKEAYIEQHSPMFLTVLAVSHQIDDSLTKEDLEKVTYLGPMYFDWDGADIDLVIPQVHRFAEQLVGLDVEMDQVKWFATGGKGFHCEIPVELFADKIPAKGWPNLPIIYKEIALDQAVDTLDLRVYSTRRGRQWRRPNVLRSNGKHKVQIDFDELMAMTAHDYEVKTSTPGKVWEPEKPTYALKLAMLFDKMHQKVTALIGKRRKGKTAKVVFREDMPTLKALCEGKGLKPGLGFNQISMQIGILAQQLRWSEQQMIDNCAGLISAHQGDSDRYSTEAKRREQLIKQHRYMDDNPCYDASVGGLKSILNHAAPDLDGVPITAADLETTIKEAEETPALNTEGPGEYDGLAGVTINRFGVYASAGEEGLKRICALSFGNVEMLKSLETGTISAIEADILVNGIRAGRAGLELDTFGSVQMFNKLCVRYGHAFQGTDANLRGLYMKTVEGAKKSGNEYYVTAREGLDMVSIPHHENELARTPFLIWSDGKGVVVEDRVKELGLNLRFQGYPDPRGQYRVDLGDAPMIGAWLEEGDNKQKMRDTLYGMLHCQRPDVISKLVGWNSACFYRMLFHKAYGKFPLLHMNAPAGTGKSDMVKASLGLFYHNQTPLVLSPASTVFALSYAASGSVTAPLVIDEYKPHEMRDDVKNNIKLLFRDAYNCRERQRGGGSRDNDDYRSMHKTQVCAPIAFIAEAVEEESAVMERVVLITMVKPHAAQTSRDFLNFRKWEANANCLALLGKYMATYIVRKSTMEAFKEEFEALYSAARDKHMLTGGIGESELTDVEITKKSGTKERTVFNYSVAAFGLAKFSELVERLFPGEFTDKLIELKEGVYTRMDDVAATTQPEWLKVFNTFSDMSMLDEGIRLESNKDYAMLNIGDRTCLELNTRIAYNKYRAYCRTSSIKPLYASETSFSHGMRDCQARVATSAAGRLKTPGGSHFFDMDVLQKLGFRGMKAT